MLALWNARAEVTVSNEKQIAFTSFPILRHSNKVLFPWFEVITARKWVCRRNGQTADRRPLINGAKRTPAKAVQGFNREDGVSQSLFLGRPDYISSNYVNSLN